MRAVPTSAVLGASIGPVALAFGVLEITDSAAWLSAVTTAALIPMVATMLLGGGIADRYREREAGGAGHDLTA